MKSIVIALLLLVGFFGEIRAQSVTGIVKDSATGELLKAASVYINNSSIGVITDDSGRFSLNRGRISAFDLIVSNIGYATRSIHITDSGRYYKILLKKKQDSMAEVTVYAADKDGWTKWGSLFYREFIGTTHAAKECHILNPEVLRFYRSEMTRVLTVVAREPLVIENAYLGYRIDFDLTQFTCDFKTQSLFYEGFPKFTQLDGSKSMMREWQRNRKTVYEGSVMHFLRTVYRGSTAGSAFRMHRVRRYENQERSRVQTLTGDFHFEIKNNFSSDSLIYYNKVRSQPPYSDITDFDTLTAFSVIQMDTDNVYLNFDDYLQVVYKGKREESEYGQRTYRAPMDKYVTGLMTLIGKPVLITSDGQFLPPQNVMLEGYWGWSEKLSNLLPIDYQEPEPD